MDWKLSELFTYLNSNYSICKVSGKDCYDLLNRISTNDLRNMQREASLSTLIVDEKARCVDRLIVYSISNMEALILSKQLDKMISWFDRFIFGDDIQFEKMDYKIVQFLNPSLIDNAMKSKIQAFINAANSTFGVFHEKDYDTIINENKLSIISDEKYTEHRIKFLLPDFPQELSQEYIPLEIGLISDISFSKGCYIGQEVIARLESQKKVFKYLAQIKSSQQLVIGKKYSIKDKNNIVKGKITTIGNTDLHLAVIHKSLIKNGTSLLIQSENELIKGSVIDVLRSQTYLSI